MGILLKTKKHHTPIFSHSYCCLSEYKMETIVAGFLRASPSHVNLETQERALSILISQLVLKHDVFEQVKVLRLFVNAVVESDSEALINSRERLLLFVLQRFRASLSVVQWRTLLETLDTKFVHLLLPSFTRAMAANFNDHFTSDTGRKLLRDFSRLKFLLDAIAITPTRVLYFDQHILNFCLNNEFCFEIVLESLAKIKISDLADFASSFLPEACNQFAPVFSNNNEITAEQLKQYNQYLYYIATITHHFNDSKYNSRVIEMFINMCNIITNTNAPTPTFYLIIENLNLITTVLSNK